MFLEGQKNHVRQWNQVSLSGDDVHLHRVPDAYTMEQTPKAKMMLYPYYVMLWGGFGGVYYFTETVNYLGSVLTDG